MPQTQTIETTIVESDKGTRYALFTYAEHGFRTDSLVETQLHLLDHLEPR